MLAQSFKTAAQLQISKAEHETLVKVLGMLERGEIKPSPQRGRSLGFLPLDKLADYEIAEPEFFDMRHVICASDCGTSCCILGWAQYVSDDAVFNYNHSNRGLGYLFYPNREGVDCTNPQQGAMALRNYLTSGFPRWREVMRP
jgi:hypothetical protein